jgi:histidinol-phosphate aminotransferase
MIVSKELAPHFENIVQPCHNVSGVSSEAAIAALEDLDHLRQNVDWITAARDQLAASLSEIPGVHPFPSATNFLLVGLPVDDAGPVVAELAKRGILVRHFRHPALRSSLRVTIGQQHENEAFLRELSNILGDR